MEWDGLFVGEMCRGILWGLGDMRLLGVSGFFVVVDFG